MKTILIPFLLCLSAMFAKDQVITPPHFCRNINLEKTGEGDKIVFTVNSEVNIKCYIIEGSVDSINFDFINAIRCRGNTVVPKTYQFINELPGYRAFRIKQIDYTSLCIGMENIGYKATEKNEPPDAISEKYVVKY